MGKQSKNNKKTKENLAQNENVVYNEHTTEKFKDSLFTKIFSMPEHFKSVYGAILDKDISDKEVELFNNEPMLTVDIRNDVAMLVEDRLIVFIEHQSTVNNNMPLRMLWYTSIAFKRFIKDELQTVFSTKQIALPTPEFYVFYAGAKPWRKDFLKLSDAYKNFSKSPMLDLKVEVINMRDETHPVMKKCKEATIYIELIEKIENLMQYGKSRDDAITIALEEISKKDTPLHNFLTNCELEVKNMINYQLTLEEVAEHAARIRQQEYYEDGKLEGKKEGKREGKRETAQNLINMGLSIEQVAQGTGLTEAEVLLIKNVKK